MADALVGYCRRKQRELGPERAAEFLKKEARRRKAYNQTHAEEIEADRQLHDMLMWSGGYETKPGRPLPTPRRVRSAGEAQGGGDSRPRLAAGFYGTGSTTTVNSISRGLPASGA